VAEREASIKWVLQEKKFRIPEGFPSDNPFCHQFMDDLKTFNEMEIIAPDIIANGLNSPEVRSRIIREECGGSLRVFGRKQPRKVVLYHVDIDNNPGNGQEWVLADHYVRSVSPQWGKELVVTNRYAIFENVNGCYLLSGEAFVGASARYAPDTRAEGMALDTGIHGVFRYRGRYYIYDVINEPKVDPFRLHEYPKPDGNHTTSICRIKEQRRRAIQEQGE
jgi:hypothetical protein